MEIIPPPKLKYHMDVFLYSVCQPRELFISRLAIETTTRLSLENNDGTKCYCSEQAVSPNDIGILISTFKGSCVTEQ